MVYGSLGRDLLVYCTWLIRCCCCYRVEDEAMGSGIRVLEPASTFGSVAPSLLGASTSVGTPRAGAGGPLRLEYNTSSRSMGSPLGGHSPLGTPRATERGGRGTGLEGGGLSGGLGGGSVERGMTGGSVERGVDTGGLGGGVGGGSMERGLMGGAGGEGGGVLGEGAMGRRAGQEERGGVGGGGFEPMGGSVGTGMSGGAPTGGVDAGKSIRRIHMPPEAIRYEGGNGGGGRYSPRGGVEGGVGSSKLMQAIERQVAEGGGDGSRSPRDVGYRDQGPGFVSGDLQGVMSQGQQQQPLRQQQGGGMNGVASAPAGSDAGGLGDVMGGRKMAPGALGGGGGVREGEFSSSMAGNVMSEAAAAGEEVIFRPNPAENAPGMVPHARHLGAV